MSAANLLLMSLIFGWMSCQEETGSLAKEELDNYTVFLMQNNTIQATGSYKDRCPGGFRKQQILYVPKQALATSNEFFQFLGDFQSQGSQSPQGSQNIHYVIISCLEESGASKSQLVLYGNSFQTATQQLPPGCSTPIVPKVVNPELDKCKKGNDMIESLVKTVISNQTASMFTPQDLAPFVDQINKIAQNDVAATTDVESFKQTIAKTYNDLNNVKLQMVKDKVNCIKNKITQTINVQLSIVAVCAMQTDLNKVISALLTQELVKQIKGLASPQAQALANKLLQSVKTDNEQIVSLDAELKFSEKNNISAKLINDEENG